MISLSYTKRVWEFKRKLPIHQRNNLYFVLMRKSRDVVFNFFLFLWFLFASSILQFRMEKTKKQEDPLYRVWKWRIFGALFMGYFLYSMNRKSITFAAPGMLRVRSPTSYLTKRNSLLKKKILEHLEVCLLSVIQLVN